MSEVRSPGSGVSEHGAVVGAPSTTRAEAATFPFTAVVGMDDMGLALCLSAVAPGIGGVLVRGEKGTAKSTIVRGLAAVLPPVRVVDGCRFACDPARPDADCPDRDRVLHDLEHAVTRPVRLVELPVGASEDRVVGSLHLGELLSTSTVQFEPGLLAQAHRGLLYVDEINLLPDHLVDTLLDSAAMGRARIEREGVSITHEARFVMVGTMNPEEGELRPQLLDRFGLAVDVAASRDVDTRVEVVRRRMAYEADPAGFVAGYAERQGQLERRIAAAEQLLTAVRLTDDAVRKISTICAEFDVDGMRGDLVTARTACAHAAWCGRTEVNDEDIRVAARLALPHRRRRTPFDDQGGDDLEDILDEHVPDTPDGPEGPDDTPDGDGPDDGGGPGRPDSDGDEGPRDDAQAPTPEHGPASDADAAEAPAERGSPAPTPQGSGGTTDARPHAPYRARLFALPHSGAGVAGRRSSADVATGRHVRAVAPEDPRGRGIALGPTVISAATRLAHTAGAGADDVPGPSSRPSVSRLGGIAGEDRAAGAGPTTPGRGGTASPRPHVEVEAVDLRRSLRRGKEGNLVVFAVDTSGSMGATERIRQVKTACVSLLLDAYQRRDKVAVVTFAKKEARVVLPPTSSVDLAQRLLSEVPTGGRTPLAEGLTCAFELIRRERVRDPHRRALLVVLTDGRASAGGRDALPRARRVARRVAAEAQRSGSFGCVVVDCESTRAGFRLGLARELAADLCADHVDLAALRDGLGTVTARSA